jgi:tetratricopeptide (TPR) repeat protein
MIEANTGASSLEDNSPDFGFSLLDENEATVVREAVEQLVKLDLADETKSLALAHLYRVHNLKAEAIAILEALVKLGSKTVAVYRTLGELYTEVGLNLLAQKYYLKAIELTKSEDIEGQALVAAGLGKVYEAIASPQEAIRWLTQARDSYVTLGDTQQALELEQKLSRL